jgi:hypothetical protein
MSQRTEPARWPRPLRILARLYVDLLLLDNLLALHTNRVVQFWEIIKGSDGISRHLQWQARVEGTLNSEFE